MRFLVAGVLLLLAVPAQAQLVLRGNYWRDRNTRVLAPDAELTKELPTGTTVSASYLLDAITSASAAAGGIADHPFTELRNQFAVGVAQRFGDATVGASYRYSTESDYWANVAGIAGSLELNQKNTVLSGSFNYNSSDVGMRMGATGYVLKGTLHGYYGVAGLTQVLSKNVLAVLDYEVAYENGYLSNVYRMVQVSGSPRVENEPNERLRNTVTGSLRAAHLMPGPVRYFTGMAKLRYYVDNWGVWSVSPELRGYVALGPVELRLTGRYYWQHEADFWRANASTGIPMYTGPVRRDGCAMDGCYTGDAKLSTFSSVFLEGRAQVPLEFLDLPWLPLGAWLGRGLASLSFGYYINDRFAYRQFGNAYVGGVEVVLPL